MESLQELKYAELIDISGGVSFAYRVGQLIAMADDIFNDGVLNTIPGLKAAEDWFGEDD